MTAPTPAPRTSPYGVLVLGMLVAVLGGLIATQNVGIGLVLAGVGGLMAQFGVIAAAVELAILRSRDR